MSINAQTGEQETVASIAAVLHNLTRIFLESIPNPVDRMIQAEALGEYVGQDLRSFLASSRALACLEAVNAGSVAQVSVASGVSSAKIQSLMATAKQFLAVQALSMGASQEG